MMKGLFQNLLLGMAACGVFFIGGEIVCRVFFPDETLKYADDADCLWRFAPNQEGNDYLANGWTTPRAKINSLGLRGGEAELKKPGGVLLLGDSFTFGKGVADHETFAGRLGQALQGKTAVQNGGQPGYGVYQMINLKRSVGPAIQPKHIILVIWEGSILRQPLPEAEQAQFFERSRKIKKLKSLSVLGTHLYRLYERLSAKWRLPSLIVSLAGQKPSEDALEAQYLRALAADEKRIAALKNETAAQGCDLTVVLWPSEGFVVKSDESLNPDDAARLTASKAVQAELQKFSDAEAIPFINLQEVFRETPREQLLIPGDGHPTPYAHCLAANRLLQVIKKFGFEGAEQNCS